MDELQQRLLATLDKIGQWIEQTEDLAVEQVPQVAAELLLYTRVGSALWVFLGLCFLVIGSLFFRRLRRGVLAGERGDDLVPFFMAGMIAGVTGLVVIATSEFLKVFLAPRLYILEYLRALL